MAATFFALPVHPLPSAWCLECRQPLVSRPGLIPNVLCKPKLFSNARTGQGPGEGPGPDQGWAAASCRLAGWVFKGGPQQPAFISAGWLQGHTGSRGGGARPSALPVHQCALYQGLLRASRGCTQEQLSSRQRTKSSTELAQGETNVRGTGRTLPKPTALC